MIDASASPAAARFSKFTSSARTGRGDFDDTSRTLANISEKFRPGRVYNIAGGTYHDIKSISDTILRLCGKADKLVKYVDYEVHNTRDKRTSAARAIEEIDHRETVGLEEIALRLERFVSGSGRWLLSGQESPSVSGSAAYVLAALPDEERVAAMFLVLDRIWAGLARSGHQTLVVVDEAWWLMRHPDTASFLFRLAKTARKRRAGLTLTCL